MRMRNYRSWWLLAVPACAATPPTGPSPSTHRPNIVLVVVDDMRFDEFRAGGHPYVETPNIDRLAAEGAMFSHAFHATPLCSPNRACILTGQYASRHGVFDNTSRAHASHRLRMFPQELQRAGYTTAHVGKWHMGNDPTPRPGYDYWVSFAGQGNTFDPELYENGAPQRVPGYITDLFTDRAVKFIKGHGSKPFFLYVGHKAVHPEAAQLDDGTVDLTIPKHFIPAHRHKGRYEDRLLQRRPNYGLSDADREGKPVLMQALEMKDWVADNDPAWALWIDRGVSEETIRRRAEMMLAVDDSLGRIMATLEEMGELDETLIIFTSDNGYFYGEHDLTIERRLPYEEALRSPLLMRYPAVIEAGKQPDALVLSIDLAPTVLEVAQVEIPKHIQGRSLVPVLSGEALEVRDAAYMEYYSHENPMPWTVNLDYRVIRKGDYKYIRWIRFDDGEELYNMQNDPYEQHNLAANPEQREVLQDMRQELKQFTWASLGLGE